MAHVSVIIPTYNRAGFLAGAIRSALAQSFQDIEIVVVDDCGTDDTAAVVGRFTGVPIRYIRHGRRRGGAAARNTGIEATSAPYVAFLDDDDEWYPEKLARQVALLESSPADVGGVYTGYFIVDRADGRLRDQIVPTDRGDIYAKLLAGNCIGGTSSILLRRSCFDTVGMFDERLPSFQDYDLWIRLARKYRFEYVRAPLLKYFVHEKTISTDSAARAAGLELMLKKYGHSPAFRKKCSLYYLGLGVRQCELGRPGGCAALLRSAQLNPFALQPYLYLLLAPLAPENFRWARQLQQRLRGRSERIRREAAENA